MQFILEQQAQLTINLGKLGERVDKIGEKVDKIVEAQIAYEKRASRLEESFLRLVQLAENMDGRMDALTEAQSRTDAQLAATDKRLNALIETVERYISDGRNGRPQK